MGDDGGFTLVEMMVAMAIMATAFLIIGATLVSAANTSRRLEASSGAVDNARLASDRLDRDLRSALCITQPGENQSGNVLAFQTLSNGVAAQVTYEVAGAQLTRRLDFQTPELVASGVAATTTAFTQLATPLRTVVVDLPVVSNDSILRLRTTIAGRNTWRTC
jgi:prepilin-type N-terminal cleavage/methylation domain-containing protein